MCALGGVTVTELRTFCFSRFSASFCIRPQRPHQRVAAGVAACQTLTLSTLTHHFRCVRPALAADLFGSFPPYLIPCSPSAVAWCLPSLPSFPHSGQQRSQQYRWEAVAVTPPASQSMTSVPQCSGVVAVLLSTKLCPFATRKASTTCSHGHVVVAHSPPPPPLAVAASTTAISTPSIWVAKRRLPCLDMCTTKVHFYPFCIAFVTLSTAAA